MVGGYGGVQGLLHPILKNVMNSEGEFKNRRKFWRIPISLEVNISFDDINSFISEYSADLSAGGIFIRTNRPRKVGTAVKLSMKLNSGKKLVEAEGVVVRVVLPGDVYTGAMPGMAIKFISIDEESQEIIEKYIQSKVNEE